MFFGFRNFKSRIVIVLLLLSLVGCTTSLTPTLSVEIQYHADRNEFFWRACNHAFTN